MSICVYTHVCVHGVKVRSVSMIRYHMYLSIHMYTLGMFACAHISLVKFFLIMPFRRHI